MTPIRIRALTAILALALAIFGAVPASASPGDGGVPNSFPGDGGVDSFPGDGGIDSFPGDGGVE